MRLSLIGYMQGDCRSKLHARFSRGSLDSRSLCASEKLLIRGLIDAEINRTGVP